MCEGMEVYFGRILDVEVGPMVRSEENFEKLALNMHAREAHKSPLYKV